MESAVENQCYVDQDRLKELIQASRDEFPDIDPYFIYTLAVDHLLQEQGIFPDKDVVEEMIEKSKQSEVKVEILPPDAFDKDYPNDGYELPEEVQRLNEEMKRCAEEDTDSEEDSDNDE